MAEHTYVGANRTITTNGTIDPDWLERLGMTEVKDADVVKADRNLIVKALEIESNGVVIAEADAKGAITYAEGYDADKVMQEMATGFAKQIRERMQDGYEYADIVHIWGLHVTINDSRWATYQLGSGAGLGKKGSE